MMDRIRDLFSNNIERRIEEVIKVDQTDEEIISDEITEYVATDAIKDNFKDILDRYAETPNKPHEGVGVWVSGFFGAGKSSFAKILGLALENREIKGLDTSDLISRQIGDSKVTLLLKQIAERIPTDAVVFDVSTERGIRTSEQPLTEIMYKSLMDRFGYAKDLDLAEIELGLEINGKLDEFTAAFEELHGEQWDSAKRLPGLAIGKASVTLNKINPVGYPSADHYLKGAVDRANVSPGILAERAIKVIERRGSNQSLVFVVDEVGQFVARDVQKMLDLQGIVQSLGRLGRGRLWLVVTSQERLDELVSGLGDRRIELARLKDRFPLQVHLESSDITEVTSKRVLAKNADGQKLLRKLYESSRGRLESCTSVSADVRLPELSCDSFINLYPLLPYQVDLIIQIVSGLRLKGGLSKHVGGANRTIIKLAQQLLIHPKSGLANKDVGQLVTIDSIYDLISGNIPSDVRQKVWDIGEKLSHPFSQFVAKAICLLGYSGNIHCTTENIAATLHPSLSSDPVIPQVREALKELVSTRMVRHREGQYKLPSPAEDDWDRIRQGLSPRAHDRSRFLKEEMKSLWEPQPSHSLKGIRVFKAGLILNEGEQLTQGDVTFRVMLVDQEDSFKDRIEEMRTRSRNEQDSIFWVAGLDNRIEAEIVELYRSKQMISRMDREARTGAELALVNEEKLRFEGHRDDLKRLMSQELISGSIFFRGRDRSPTSQDDKVSKAAGRLLAEVLPEVFSKFNLAAAKVKISDIEALITHENLSGLPKVYSTLNLLTTTGKIATLAVDNEPLRIVLDYIDERSSLGERPSGRQLRGRFAMEPFGWSAETVMMLTACLFRASRVEASSKGNRITSVTDPKAKPVLTGNQLFQQASFGPKVPIDKKLLIASIEALKSSFGKQVSEINQDRIVETILEVLADNELVLDEAYDILTENSLPGLEMIRQSRDIIKEIKSNRSDPQGCIGVFNSSHSSIRDAIKRAAQIMSKLDADAISRIHKARNMLRDIWPCLSREPDLEESYEEDADLLQEALSKELIFDSLVEISKLAERIEREYNRRHLQAYSLRKSQYEEAVASLTKNSGWGKLDHKQQEFFKLEMAPYCAHERDPREDIGKIRSDIDACDGRREAIFDKMFKILAPSEETKTIEVRKLIDTTISSEEELDRFLEELRNQVQKLLSEGKSVRIK